MEVQIRHVAISRDGYTSDGRYFGIGRPLFEAEWEGVDGRLHRTTVRALTMRAARIAIADSLGLSVSQTFAPRRPRSSRESIARARAADAYAQLKLTKAWTPTWAHPDDVNTSSYWLAKKAEFEEAIIALEVSADAYEEAGNMRLADRRRRQATKLRIYPEAYARYAGEAAGRGQSGR